MFDALFKYSRADYARGELVYLGDWPAWLLYGLMLITVVSVAALLYRRRGVARWYQLAAVGVLQVAMIAVVVWALYEPSLATDRLRDGENAVALVLDTSESMTIGSPEPRFETALQRLSDALDSDELPGLAIRHYELGATAAPVESFIASTPTQNSTAIAAGLTDILEQARFSPLAAVILGSDGADTTGGINADDLARLAGYGVPVHTIGIGRTAIPEDIELAEVILPDSALPGSTVSARVTIRHDAPGEAQVKVYDGDELRQLVPVELRDGTGTTTAWIEVELDEAGPHELSFSVDGSADEPERRNNSRSKLVNVANERYRVLYFEGEPRWEYKFLRRAVSGDEDINIATLLRVSPNKFYRQGIDTPQELEEGFPTTRDELFGYDALVIGSVEAASLSTEQQTLIRDFVSVRGGSLLMLAGRNGLGNGGWGQSELADVLPVRLQPSTSDTFFRKKADVILTPQGAGSQMLRFDADEEKNREAWQTLPQVADYQVIGNLKPAATTLLNVDTEAGPVPLMVGQPYGKGQTYVLATGGTWRWQMSLPLEDMRHETFWRQLLRAIVASAPKNVSLTAGTGAESITLRAEYLDDAFNPVDGVSLTTVASHQSGETFTVPMQPGEEAGVYVGAFEPSQSGTWYFEALAEQDGEPVAIGRSSVLHESGQAEYFGFRTNPGLLQRLSEATGGRYFEAGDLDALPDELRYSSAGITETEYRSIWDAPIVFLLLIALKSSEWLLRRRWHSI